MSFWGLTHLATPLCNKFMALFCAKIIIVEHLTINFAQIFGNIKYSSKVRCDCAVKIAFQLNCFRFSYFVQHLGQRSDWTVSCEWIWYIEILWKPAYIDRCVYVCTCMFFHCSTTGVSLSVKTVAIFLSEKKKKKDNSYCGPTNPFTTNV